MQDKDQAATPGNKCVNSEDGRHVWEVKLDSPGHHGDKKLVEIFVCKNCGQKKPIRANNA